MKYILRVLTFVTIIVSAPLAGLVHADEWEEWDADGSGDLSLDEWDAGFDEEGVYEEWDLDNDGVLSNDEYSEGIFTGYDLNNDGIWDEQEYGVWQDDAGDEGFWDV